VLQQEAYPAIWPLLTPKTWLSPAEKSVTVHARKEIKKKT